MGREAAMTKRIPGPSPDDRRFRRTTLAKVKDYRRRRRYLQRGAELVEIKRVRPWGKALHVWLKDMPYALVLDPDHVAFVRQGPCRREGRAS
jgi:hypothetical protein